MPTLPPPVRVLTWDTNFAGKLDLPEFIHIARAPLQLVHERNLERIFEIRTGDESHTPVRVKLVDLLRIELCHIPDRLAIQSHGVPLFQLVNQYYPGLDLNAPMAVYYYKKCSAADT